MCDGREVSRETYSYLFNVISTLYGEGDGSTTFNLPDLTNRFIEGCSELSDVGTYLSAGLPNHTHNIDSSGGAYGAGGGGNHPAVKDYETNGYSSSQVLNSSIYGNSDTVQPPAVMMRYVIVYTSLSG